MKKVLTITAIAAFAGAAHAATLNWTMRQISMEGANLTAGSAYLFITEQSSDFGAPVVTVDQITGLVESDGDYASLAAGNVGTVRNGLVSGATGYYANFGAGDSLSAFAVIFDAEKENYILTSVQSASWAGPGGAQTLNFGSQANATWKPTASTPDTPPVVPEPATAAMALLGIGMMLNRRKA